MFTLFKHPALENKFARISLFAILALRCLFFGLLVFSLDQVVDLGTSPFALTLGTILGASLATTLAFTRLTHLGFFILGGMGYLAELLLFRILNQLPSSTAAGILRSYNLQSHSELILICLAIAAVTTWGFWKFRHALSLEIIVLAGLCIYLLSGHRNFHLEFPQIVNSLAWDFGVAPLSMLVIIGAGLVSSLLAYLYFATMPARPYALHGTQPVQLHRTRTHLTLGTGLLLLLIGTVYGVSDGVFSWFNKAAENLTSNGVGQGNEEGMSPLGFHSALGSTNQPSALLRLEGDYAENPFSPMLYLREGALSDFNGNELINADRTFDGDIPHTNPTQPFSGDEDVALLSRVPLVQSIYLLADHKEVFAADYPVSIKQLKNPNPGRFKMAYRAYSIAPGFPLSSLEEQTTGDSRWTTAKRQHYLVQHPDPRYRDLAQKITAGITNPAKQALAVKDYLSKVSIYTLTPGHEVAKGEDPVAPYLFGDHRGYCVHFAHAITYMLRSIGIPARIGTGYLTDLSQAKDGHVLLRMSDRHAWAEAYFEGKGWIPFDPQPEQVESAAETQVDMKTLEELMGLLEPGEEILPDKVIEDEANVEEPPRWILPGRAQIGWSLLVILMLLVLIKLYLRLGWLLPGSAFFRLRRSYVSVLSSLYDLGYERLQGETRQEFRQRMNRELGFEALTSTDSLINARYAPQGRETLELGSIRQVTDQDLRAIRKIPLWKRILAALNPVSAIKALDSSKW